MRSWWRCVNVFMPLGVLVQPKRSLFHWSFQEFFKHNLNFVYLMCFLFFCRNLKKNCEKSKKTAENSNIIRHSDFCSSKDLCFDLFNFFLSH